VAGYCTQIVFVTEFSE